MIRWLATNFEVIFILERPLSAFVAGPENHGTQLKNGYFRWFFGNQSSLNIRPNVLQFGLTVTIYGAKL